MIGQPRTSDRYNSKQNRNASVFTNTIKSETIYGEVQSQETTNGPKEKSTGGIYYGPVYLNPEDGCMTHVSSYDIWMTAADGRQYCLDICGNPIYKDGIYSGAERSSSTYPTSSLGNMIFTPVQNTSSSTGGGDETIQDSVADELRGLISDNTANISENRSNIAQLSGFTIIYDKQILDISLGLAKDNKTLTSFEAAVGVSYTNYEFTTQPVNSNGQVPMSGLLRINGTSTVVQPGSTLTLSPPFFNESKELITSFPGRGGITIDMTKPLTIGWTNTYYDTNIAVGENVNGGGAVMFLPSTTVRFLRATESITTLTSSLTTLKGGSTKTIPNLESEIQSVTTTANANASSLTTLKGGSTKTIPELSSQISALQTEKVNVSGDTMTGNLLIETTSNPTLTLTNTNPTTGRSNFIQSRDDGYFVINVDGNPVVTAIGDAVNIMPSSGVWVSNLNIQGNTKVYANNAIEYLGDVAPSSGTTNRLYPVSGVMYYDGKPIYDKTQVESLSNSLTTLKGGSTKTIPNLESEIQSVTTTADANASSLTTLKGGSTKTISNLESEIQSVTTTANANASSLTTLKGGSTKTIPELSQEIAALQGNSGGQPSGNVIIQSGYAIEYLGDAPSVTTKRLYPVNDIMFYNGAPVGNNNPMIIDLSATVDDILGDMTTIKTNVSNTSNQLTSLDTKVTTNQTNISTLESNMAKKTGNLSLYQYDVYKFTMQSSSGSGYINGDYTINGIIQPVGQAPSTITLSPPFYNSDGSVMTTYPDCIRYIGSPLTVNMDLTKDLTITKPFSDTYMILGTDTTGNQATFKGSASVVLIKRGIESSYYYVTDATTIVTDFNLARNSVITSVPPTIGSNLLTQYQPVITNDSLLTQENTMLKDRVANLESSIDKLTKLLITAGLISDIGL